MPVHQTLRVAPSLPLSRAFDLLHRALPHSGDTGLPVDLPAFAQFSIGQRQRLDHAKPNLLQEHYKSSPWHVLVLAYILARTSSEDPRSFVWYFFRLFPSPFRMIHAPIARIKALLTDIGLCDLDAVILVNFSEDYRLHWPTISFTRNCVRALGRAQRHRNLVLACRRQRGRDIPTPVSRTKDIGKFMLDCYAVFCCEDEWRSVRSDDEDLTRYLQWRWALEGKMLCPHTGEVSIAGEDYIEELIEELNIVYET